MSSATSPSGGGRVPSSSVTGFLDGVLERQLVRPDGRVVAWSEWGDPGGRPVLRVPGTPGCRYWLRADRTPWIERGLWMVTTERPGFGVALAICLAWRLAVIHPPPVACPGAASAPVVGAPRDIVGDRPSTRCPTGRRISTRG